MGGWGQKAGLGTVFNTDMGWVGVQGGRAVAMCVCVCLELELGGAWLPTIFTRDLGWLG